jgi:hypothetical protein
MNLSEFLFMDFSERKLLREIQKVHYEHKMNMLTAEVRNPIPNSDSSQILLENLNKRLNVLEDAFGYQTLILESILHKLDEKGVVSKQDIKESMDEIDMLDGVKDGKLNLNTLLLLLRK